MESEFAAVNAHIAEADLMFQSVNKRLRTIVNLPSRLNLEVLKLMSDTNFPEDEKQRILAKMRVFGSDVLLF